MRSVAFHPTDGTRLASGVTKDGAGVGLGERGVRGDAGGHSNWVTSVSFNLAADA